MLFSERIMDGLLSRFQSTRVSYELKPEEAEVIRANYNAASGALYQPARSGSLQPPSNTHSAREFCTWKEQHPSILEHFQDFAQLVKGKRLAVFLDYDGTLTPIVKDPDRAFMSNQMRSAVQSVAGLFPTSIISGRGREKVEGFVQLKELFYAGSHGMDIVGPQGNCFTTLVSALAHRDGDDSSSSCSSRCLLSNSLPDTPKSALPTPKSDLATPKSHLSKASSRDGHEQPLAFQPAAKYAPIMDTVYKSLMLRVENISGAAVEHNKFCVSVHFRNCSLESYEHVVSAVKDTLNEHPNLKASRGRKVLEIQPQVDWGKGRALSHMLNALGLDKAQDVIPIYLGDDRTDEDAFKVLKGRATGFGILISNKMKETDAKYTLTDPTEVMAFLTLLLQWGATLDNAWHSHKSCTGWSLKQQHAPPPPTQPHDSAHPSRKQESPLAEATSENAHAHAQDHSDLQKDLRQQCQQNCSALEGSHAQASQQVEAKHDAPATPSSSLHSPTAFARVRQFHGLPASSDRAMPASQWLTKTDSLTSSKPDTQSASPTQHVQAEAGHKSPGGLWSSAAEPADDQAGLDEYSQMVGSSAAGVRQLQSVGRGGGGKQIQAEGRPPTGKEVEKASGQEAEGAEEASTPPPRTSLDHYLRQPYKASEEDDESNEAGHMGHWDAGEGIMPEREVAQLSRSRDTLHEARSSGEHCMASMPPFQEARPGQRMPEGKRLTALLLDKLQGHDSARSGGDEGMSPPGLSSHSTSSMAGYQSPFESLANEGGFSASEDTDSIRAEIGSVASINLAPSK